MSFDETRLQYELRDLRSVIVDELIPLLKELTGTPVAKQQRDFDELEAQQPPPPPCYHQQADGKGACDLDEHGVCKHRVDSYKAIMKHLTGYEDADDRVMGLTPELAANRERIRAWLDAHQNRFFNDGPGEQLEIDGQTYYPHTFKEWQHQTAYELLKRKVWPANVAAETHMLPEEVQRLKKHFNL
jgi:hypothetical protein